MAKTYLSNEGGKRDYINDVINPIVVNDGHFKSCEYLNLTEQRGGEYIVLHPHDPEYEKERYINISADSIQAIFYDFARQILNIIGE